MINGNKKIPSTELYIIGSLFLKNGASFGGALFFGQLISAIKQATVSDCIFQENKALSCASDET